MGLSSCLTNVPFQPGQELPLNYACRSFFWCLTVSAARTGCSRCDRVALMEREDEFQLLHPCSVSLAMTLATEFRNLFFSRVWCIELGCLSALPVIAGYVETIDNRTSPIYFVHRTVDEWMIALPYCLPGLTSEFVPRCFGLLRLQRFEFSL